MKPVFSWAALEKAEKDLSAETLGIEGNAKSQRHSFWSCAELSKQMIMMMTGASSLVNSGQQVALLRPAAAAARSLV